MELPVMPPVEPMLAKAATKVPLGASEATGKTAGASEATGKTAGASEATGKTADEGAWSYEPKWDGFLH